MTKKVFVDGSAGTTGLRILSRLADRTDLDLLTLPEETRKDPEARKAAIFEADVAFLCLPDDAAKEAAALARGSDTIIIDTSTAHRTNDAWTYGFPEIHGLREQIRSSKRIANPGCYASGFISLAAPLVEKGLLSSDTALTCFGISGYSGGGKKMIAQYEGEAPDPLLEAPRLYALTQSHKHLPEMVKQTGLTQAPVFTPVVSSYYSGMEIIVPVFAKDLKGSIKDVEEIYAGYYNNGLVHFVKNADESGFLSAGAFSGKDTMEITVHGNDDRILLISRFDNLGKGASGAAIQNMNLALGIEEACGLVTD